MQAVPDSGYQIVQSIFFGRGLDANTRSTMASAYPSIVKEGAPSTSKTATRKPDLDFSQPWTISDLVLVVEGKRFHVHRCILSMCSPVFDRMLTSDFKEKNASEIPLPGKKADEIEELLRAIYPYVQHRINEENCFSLLELSCEYQMDRLKKRCEQYFLIKNMTSEEALEFVVMAQRHQLSDELIHRCMSKFVSQETNWETLKKNELFSQLEQRYSQQLVEERVKYLEKRLASCKSTIEILKMKKNDKDDDDPGSLSLRRHFLLRKRFRDLDRSTPFD